MVISRDITLFGGSLTRLLDLPLEILEQIFFQLRPGDLLRLARSCKLFARALLTQSDEIKRRWHNRIWVHARNDFLGLPAPPSDITEPDYAAYFHDQCCAICGQQASFANLKIRLRVCPFHINQFISFEEIHATGGLAPPLARILTALLSFADFERRRIANRREAIELAQSFFDLGLPLVGWTSSDQGRFGDWVKEHKEVKRLRNQQMKDIGEWKQKYNAYKHKEAANHADPDCDHLGLAMKSKGRRQSYRRSHSLGGSSSSTQNVEVIENFEDQVWGSSVKLGSMIGQASDDVSSNLPRYETTLSQDEDTKQEWTNLFEHMSDANFVSPDDVTPVDSDKDSSPSLFMTVRKPPQHGIQYSLNLAIGAPNVMEEAASKIVGFRSVAHTLTAQSSTSPARVKPDIPSMHEPTHVDTLDDNISITTEALSSLNIKFATCTTHTVSDDDLYSLFGSDDGEDEQDAGDGDYTSETSEETPDIIVSNEHTACPSMTGKLSIPTTPSIKYHDPPLDNDTTQPFGGCARSASPLNVAIRHKRGHEEDEDRLHDHEVGKKSKLQHLTVLA